MKLVGMRNNSLVTTSLLVAKEFGKQHKDVIKTIKSIVAQNCATLKMFSKGTHEVNGREYPMYYMNRDGFSLLVMGFTGKDAMKFKLEFIDAFNSMEAKTKADDQKQLPKTPQEITKALLDNMNTNNEDIKALRNDVDYLKSERKLDEGEYSYITKTVSLKVNRIAKEQNLNNEQRSLLFKDIGGQILSLTGIRFRSQLQLKHFEDVCELLKNWYPSTKTVVEIKKIGRQTTLKI